MAAESRESRIRELMETLLRRGLAMTRESARQLAESMVQTEQKVQQRYQERRAQTTQTTAPIGGANQTLGELHKAYHDAESDARKREAAAAMRERATNPRPVDVQVQYDTPKFAMAQPNEQPENEEHGPEGGSTEENGWLPMHAVNDAAKPAVDTTEHDTPEAADEPTAAADEDLLSTVAPKDVPPLTDEAEAHDAAAPIGSATELADEAEEAPEIEEAREGDVPEVMEWPATEEAPDGEGRTGIPDVADESDDSARQDDAHIPENPLDLPAPTPPAEEASTARAESGTESDDGGASTPPIAETREAPHTNGEQSGSTNEQSDDASLLLPEKETEEEPKREDLGKKHGVDLSNIFNVNK